MASSGDPEPSWLAPDNDNTETEPLFGTGDVALQDAEPESKDEEAQQAPVSYGATEAKEEEKEPEWHEDKAPAPKKKAAKKKTKTIRISQSLHEIIVNRPHRPFCLVVFYCIQLVAIVASICLLVTQTMPFFYGTVSEIGYLQLALRFYIACYCILFVLVEWDLPLPFVRNSQMLQSYVSRGFLYSFIGLIGMEVAYSDRITNMMTHVKDISNVSWAALFMQISSWIMFVIGVLYMVMGIFCLKGLRQRMKDNYQAKLAEYKKGRKAVEKE